MYTAALRTHASICVIHVAVSLLSVALLSPSLDPLYTGMSTPISLQTCKKLALFIWQNKMDVLMQRTVRKKAYVWPSRAVSSLSGARTSQSFMLLSTDAVAITQSLYLHQSADRISKACAAMLSVGLACRRSQIFTLQSPEALMKTSACAGFLQALCPGISAEGSSACCYPGMWPSLTAELCTVWPAVMSAS